MVKSISFSLAKVTSPSTSLPETLTHSPNEAIPGFPGAQYTFSTKEDLEAAKAKACSLPPVPITRIFMFLSPLSYRTYFNIRTLKIKVLPLKNKFYTKLIFIRFHNHFSIHLFHSCLYRL